MNTNTKDKPRSKEIAGGGVHHCQSVAIIGSGQGPELLLTCGAILRPSFHSFMMGRSKRCGMTYLLCPVDPGGMDHCAMRERKIRR